MSLMNTMSDDLLPVATTEVSSYDLEEEENLNLPVWVTTLGGAGMIILILLAVVGNLLVIVSYFRDKQLQTVHNMYILNLAVTDLLIGAICMTFYADFTLRPWVWIYGKVFCKIWCVTDYAMCLQSVLLILILSLDRVILLRSGAQYIAKETKKVAKMKLLISWCIAFGVYGPCVVFWDIIRGYSVVEDENCDAEFLSDTGFSTTSAVCEMTIPFIALSVLNAMVFLEIRKRSKIFYKERNKVTPSDDTKVAITAASESMVHKTGAAENKVNKSDEYPKQSADRRNVKAAKFLAVLVVAFFITWAPYTIANLIASQCAECVNHHLYEFFTWLLWAKSSINPFLYAAHSKHFRDNFARLLPFQKYFQKCLK